MSEPFSTTQSEPNIPAVIAGPMLRRVDAEQLVIWLVTSRPIQLDLDWQVEVPDQHVANPLSADSVQQSTFQVGQKAYIHLITVNQSGLHQPGHFYRYRVLDKNTHADIVAPDLYYESASAFRYCYNQTLTNVIHGSCRKPHFAGDDALAQIDVMLQDSPDQPPDLIMMSGDQIYADDVAGPTLFAIRQVIELLGLFDETLDGASISNGHELDDSPLGYYQREQLLPKTEDNGLLAALFFKAKRKPIFTSVNAKNHLITASEIIAMYLLVWSPVMWRFVSLARPSHIDSKYHDLYQSETTHVEGFIKSLPAVARAFAHVPTYMIFDDHDVTDDWNLTRRWEEAVYNNPLSKRMIGNALLGYWLCQGWANNPTVFKPLMKRASETFTEQGLSQQDAFIDQLLDWQQWHYCLDTNPPLYVMDTRTRRWRSESNPDKPSGLLDWEALCEFQQKILGKPSVIVVSAAPIYGLKFIETVQKVFTFFGQALMVDAENWMAHKGTAEVILNIFRHYKTPPKFIILSGDVHYSFVYDVTLKFRRNSPQILQFTCSGFKNAFPTGLLRVFERINNVLYAKRSPLNWLTRRRNMRVDERDPKPEDLDSVLGHVVNAPAMGQLRLDKSGDAQSCNVILADGKIITFIND